jgi:hypothetical protein
MLHPADRVKRAFLVFTVLFVISCAASSGRDRLISPPENGYTTASTDGSPTSCPTMMEECESRCTKEPMTGDPLQTLGSDYSQKHLSPDCVKQCREQMDTCAAERKKREQEDQRQWELGDKGWDPRFAPPRRQ